MMTDAPQRPAASPEERERSADVRLGARLAEARSRERQGDAQGALAHLLEAPEDEQAYASYHYATGALRFRRGDVAGARTSFERTVGIEPAIAEHWANLGSVMLQQARNEGDPPLLEKALATLTHAVSLSPRLPIAHNSLGLALLAKGRPEEALRAFEQALVIAPTDAAAGHNRAAALQALGRTEDALGALDDLLAHHPTQPRALYSRCQALARLGRRAEAEAALKDYLAAAPDAGDDDVSALRMMIASA
ncbi:MAG: tetratricopeptide repeat protein [Planctomycetota bacterium]|jgi:tetratricopeptide (TPR) repeat protein